jgi:hypothetical protein
MVYQAKKDGVLWHFDVPAFRSGPPLAAGGRWEGGSQAGGWNGLRECVWQRKDVIATGSAELRVRICDVRGQTVSGCRNPGEPWRERRRGCVWK